MKYLFLLTFLLNLYNTNSFAFHGATSPLGVFDPFKFQEKTDLSTLARFRESELKHGRWAMIAASTIPLIETKTHSPAIHEFDKLPANLQLGIVGIILMGEGASMLKGWKNPFENGTSNYFKLEDDYQPGDLGFEISNHDDVDLHNKELNNGRLAMIAAAGMIAQELVTNKPLLFSDTLW